MENNQKKCSFNEHENIEAISYCFKCQIYLCNKCMNLHKGFFNDHPVDNLGKITDETFTGFCKEENHNSKLEYFCKNHNKLCCALCLCKIKGKGKGQHTDCDICFIEDIKEEKKSKLKDNIKSLEELGNKLDEAIKNLKLIFDKVNESKEKLKLDIQKIFTKIRCELNDREDSLLLEVDNYYDNNFCNEDIIKKSDKLPIKIKTSLEKGKLIENEWKDDDNKLNILINDCINIENNLKDINAINDAIKKYNGNNKINYLYQADVDNIINKVKNFGYLTDFDIDSKIIQNCDEWNKFLSLVYNYIKVKNSNLLYRSSRDGLNYLNIVNKINNKSNLIFLYLTDNDRIFGAYIKTKLENIDLNGSRKYYRDDNAFAFSLNNNKIYKILVPQNAIGIDSTYYILIGNNGNGNGFYFGDGNLCDAGLVDGAKIYDFSKNSEMTEGPGTFKELEIFEINME